MPYSLYSESSEDTINGTSDIISAIKEARVEQLRQVDGISEKNAQEIYNFYHKL